MRTDAAGVAPLITERLIDLNYQSKLEPVPGLDLFEGDEIALSGAFALSLAMRGGDATADHGHAH